ncbi:hypothetical protein UlMin_031894 [Ulmus minor]
MSEFPSTKKIGFLSFLLSDLLHFCFFPLSHPLYFSYFIFFSPYLLKLFSFLSPLFITTSLLLLSFLSTISSPSHVQDDSTSDLSGQKLGFLAATYQAVSERLRSKAGEEDEEEFQHFEEFEVYKIVFDTSTMEFGEDPFEELVEVVKETCSESLEAPTDKCSIHEDNNVVVLSKEDQIFNFEENPVEISPKEITQSIVGVERLKRFFEEKKGMEELSYKKEDKEVKPKVVEADKVEDQREKMFTRSESKAIIGNKIKEAKESSDNYESLDQYWDCDQDTPNLNMEDSQEVASNLGSFGSMRREKEWRRTLACKLFEERHNADAGEGMDLLWETYENESTKGQAKNNSKKGKKGVLDYDEEDDDDYEDNNAQLCCLQALKFSAGKMNLGMGRPNLVKFSKALKGMGWLHHVTKHGKKRYH